jgi:hypothetical protein
MQSGQVSRAAYLLGFAGLLPQGAAVWLTTGDHSKLTTLGYAVALFYGAVILSFLGGVWWGLAMRRADHQAPLAAAAVMPSLVAVAIIAWAGVLGTETSPGPLVALGVALLLTLPIDRYLATTGEAPAGWMSLRVPLSLGLGGLTILAGVLAR